MKEEQKINSHCMCVNNAN